MRNKFILWLSLLIAFSITFHSCRTDLEATGKHNEEKVGEHIHQKISTGTFQKETFLSGVNEFKKSNNSLSGKSSSNSDYLKRFFIDETSIYKMDVNNTQTYALRAYNIFESPETVYNLVYRKNGNDVAFSIVKILDNELIPVYDSQKGIVTKIDNPSTAKLCTSFYSVEIWHCKEGVSWSQCDKCSECLFTSSGYTTYDCGGSGGSTGGGGGTGGDGGGGGGTGLYDPSGYIIDPNIPPSTEPSYVRAARASSFFYSQTDQAKSWAVEHADIYCSILEYYLDHIPPSSPPPNSYYQDFANFAIQVFMQNPDLTWEQFYSQFINNPCEKIKTQRSNPDFNNKMTDLQGKVALKKETGYIQRTNGQYTYKDNTSATDINNSLGLPNPDLPENKDIKGYMHTHVNDYTTTDGDERKGVKIFSPADVVYFMDMIKNAQDAGRPLGDVYGVMISNTNNYQIRFTGNKFQIKTFTIAEAGSHREPFIDVMKDFLNNQKKLELGFLKYIQKEMLLYGVTLYRMNGDGTTTEIKLNADKTDTVENTCPN